MSDTTDDSTSFWSKETTTLLSELGSGLDGLNETDAVTLLANHTRRTRKELRTQPHGCFLLSSRVRLRSS